MMTRCPGCGKEIEESLDICPHCKRDFTIAVQGTGRRVGAMDGSKINPTETPAAKPADNPPAKAPPKPAAKTPPTPAAKDDPRAKKPAPKAPPPKGDLNDLPPHMRAELEAPPKGDSLDDLPPHMRAEIEAPPKGDSLDDLPAHMRAEIGAPPGGFDDSALPPHMRGEALDSFSPRPLHEKKGNPIMYVIIAAVFVGGFIISRVTMKKAPAEAPRVEEVAAPVRELPDPTMEDANETAGDTKPVSPEDEAAKLKEMGKASISFGDGEPPPEIEDGDAPPIEAPKKKPQRKSRRAAPAVIPEGERLGAAPAAPAHDKWRFRAKVFNMVTLAPAAGVQVAIFDIATSQRYPTETGEDGEFRKTVPPSSAGYKLVLQHDDYEARFLPGSAHDFQSLSEGERKEIGKKLKQFSVKIRPIMADGEGYVKQTFYLLPREKHGMSLEEALDR
ncbi:MAG: hypothetical protein ABIJ96_07415 [Elusimicrobiota bacterium]